jgi:hypothetical protein
MKKMLMICCALGLLAVPLGVAQVYAAYGTDKTQPDTYYNNETWHGNYEDQETEPGTYTGQGWDLEAFKYDSATNKLAIVGGFNFVTGYVHETGQPAFTVPLGALFLKVGPDAPPFGASNTVTGSSPPDSNNSNWGYDFAVKFTFNSNNTGGTYTVYKDSGLNGDIPAYTATVVLRSSDGVGQSNPWDIGLGWALVNTGFFNYESGKADFDGYLGGSHNVISGINLGFLPADEAFWAHITYQCGNDNLMGFAATPPTGVPIPGSLLLLGSGLAGLGLTGFRRRKKVG